MISPVQTTPRPRSLPTSARPNSSEPSTTNTNSVAAPTTTAPQPGSTSPCFSTTPQSKKSQHNEDPPCISYSVVSSPLCDLCVRHISSRLQRFNPFVTHAHPDSAEPAPLQFARTKAPVLAAYSPY